LVVLRRERERKREREWIKYPLVPFNMATFNYTEYMYNFWLLHVYMYMYMHMHICTCTCTYVHVHVPLLRWRHRRPLW
jgi:hypothetical protein